MTLLKWCHYTAFLMARAYTVEREPGQVAGSGGLVRRTDGRFAMWRLLLNVCGAWRSGTFAREGIPASGT
jgi:hypothetical protein